jgi:hypothetical protein
MIVGGGRPQKILLKHSLKKKKSYFDYTGGNF